MEDIHDRGNPFRESFVAILGLAGRWDLLFQDVEDSLGGFTGLKPRKERMLGKIFFGLTFVSFQSSIEDGRII